MNIPSLRISLLEDIKPTEENISEKIIDFKEDDLSLSLDFWEQMELRIISFLE